MGHQPDFNYAGAEGSAYHEERKLPPGAEAWLAHVRADKIQPWVGELQSVFEYGVGFGWNLLRLRCARKVGFDISPNLREIVTSRGITFVDDLSLIPGDAFDVVICHHTLEHLKDPAGALKESLRILKPGGRLILFTPYKIERKYRTYNPNDRSHHLFSWTPSSLSNLVLASGFKLEGVELRKFRFDRFAAILARKLHLGETAYRVFRRLGLLLLPEYEIMLRGTKPL